MAGVSHKVDKLFVHHPRVHVVGSIRTPRVLCTSIASSAFLRLLLSLWCQCGKLERDQQRPQPAPGCQSLCHLVASHSVTWLPVTVSPGCQSQCHLVASHSVTWLPVTVSPGCQSQCHLVASHSVTWLPVTVSPGCQSQCHLVASHSVTWLPVTVSPGCQSQCHLVASHSVTWLPVTVSPYLVWHPEYHDGP